MGLLISLETPVRAGRGARPAGAQSLSVGREARRRIDQGPVSATIHKIIAAAQTLLLTPGGRRVSAKDVCEAADVSRGTLYRYFASMDEILEAVALRLRDQTDLEMRRAVEGFEDPNQQFEAFLTYMACNDEVLRATRLIQVEPLFVLTYLRSNFQHFIGRVLDVMDPVFDAWEAHLGRPLERDAIAELMVRLVLSEMIVPTAGDATPLPIRLRPLVGTFLGEAPAPAAT